MLIKEIEPIDKPGINFLTKQDMEASDIINTIILLLLRKEIRASKISTSELFGVAQSWMCFYSRRNDEILIETPNLQTKELCKLLGIKKIPINIKNFATEIENFYQGK